MLKSRFAFFASVVIICMLFAPNTIAHNSPTDANTPPYPIITSQTYVELYNKVIESVVTIIVEVEGEGQGKFINNLPPNSPFNKLFKDKGEEMIPRSVGKGSGYIVSEDGLVYTNHHVIYGAKESQPNMKIVEIIILWHDDRYRNATIVASDAVADIAILQIEKEGDEKFQALPFANSEQVFPGTMVAAIGTPLDHPFSITSGIISGVGRPTGQGIWVTMLQTDTVINKGNSGGPLLNLKGEVIGMNTLIMSPSGYYIGIGYAIPSNTIIDVARNLLDFGEMIRPWIGVQVSNLSDDFKRKFNIDPAMETIIFANVKPDGPAGVSGFQSYDIILKINGELLTANELIELISNSKPGDKYECLVRRILDFENAVYEDVIIVLTIGKMPAAGMK